MPGRGQPGALRTWRRAGGAAGILPALLLVLLLAGNAGVARGADAMTGADVEVQITRALYHLQRGQFSEAREDTAEILDLDPTGRARYYHGVACSRLSDWTCAGEHLEGIAAGPRATWFPRLWLELGVVRYQQGRIDEARALLERAAGQEQSAEEATRLLSSLPRAAGSVNTAAGVGAAPSRRRWQAGIAVGAGYDSNIVGRPDTPGFSCDSHTIDAYELPRACGVVVSEQGFVAFYPKRLSERDRIRYQFAHRWFPNVSPSWPDAARHLFDTQDHRLVIGTGLPARLELQYELEALSVNQAYNPLYALKQEGSVRWAGPPIAALSWDLAYQLGLDRYGDLETVWNLEGGATCAATDDAGGVSLYCTAGQSGLRHRSILEASLKRPGWTSMATLDAEWRQPRGPVYRGFLLEGRLESDVSLSDAVRLQVGVLTAYERFTDPARDWTLRSIRPDARLRALLGAHLEMRLRYTMSWDQIRGTETGSTSDYVRHLAFMEVAYGVR